VLVDREGRMLGTAPKTSVHGPDTPLHLAFSSYVFDGEGRVLLSRRADHKITWPGAWTNSCCGHPLPGEPLDHAVIRRLSYELGIDAARADLMLPAFAYRAVMGNGIVEHELCPVYTARTRSEPVLNPLEVVEAKWVDPADLAVSLVTTPWAFSPWLVLQAEQLRLFGAAAEQRRAS
jgi:isopentenyl-diphosphate Delta-isomerase